MTSNWDYLCMLFATMVQTTTSVTYFLSTSTHIRFPSVLMWIQLLWPVRTSRTACIPGCSRMKKVENRPGMIRVLLRSTFQWKVAADAYLMRPTGRFRQTVAMTTDSHECHSVLKIYQMTR